MECVSTGNIACRRDGFNSLQEARQVVWRHHYIPLAGRSLANDKFGKGCGSPKVEFVNFVKDSGEGTLKVDFARKRLRLSITRELSSFLRNKARKQKT